MLRNLFVTVLVLAPGQMRRSECVDNSLSPHQSIPLFFPPQPKQENDRRRNGHGRAQEVNSADERSGYRFDLPQYDGSKETPEVADRVDQSDAPGGGGFGQEKTR